MPLSPEAPRNAKIRYIHNAVLKLNTSTCLAIYQYVDGLECSNKVNETPDNINIRYTYLSDGDLDKIVKIIDDYLHIDEKET
jgi:hypothetical protein